MRKAQGGINAAILVAVIAGVIILYILFLPASERESLLENKSVKKTTSEEEEEENVLLREFPGRIDIVEEIEDKTIPNVFLVETTNAKELERINPFIVRNGWFDKKSKIVSFGIDDLENTDNIILSFNTKKHEGILTISLNNEIIYESDISSETVAPIRLNKNILREQNTFEFSVSSVGIRFWRTNEYSLDDIKIIGDITDRSKQESRNVFTLTGTELNNIEQAELRFVPYCRRVADVGILDVIVNNKNIYSAIPDCDYPHTLPLSLGILNVGENKVIFKTNKGSYSMEQIKIEFDKKEVATIKYYFDELVNQSLIDAIEDEEKDVILTMEFIDDDENKMADLNINGRFLTLDDDERIFTKNINDYIEEGNNFIEIRPRTKLDIVELRVEIEEK